MPVPYQDPIKNIIDGMLTAYDLSHRIKFQKLQEEAYARQTAQQEREASIKDILTQQQLLGAGRPISGGAVSVPTSTPYQYNLSVPSPDHLMDDLPRIDPGNTLRAPFTTPMTGAGTITENILRKADPSRSVKYKTLGGNEMNVELFTPEEQQQRQTQAELNKMWAEAQNRETIQNRMRTITPPKEIVELFPFLAGKLLSQDELINLTKEAGALKKQGTTTLAPGAQLIQDGKPVVTNPQPARPVTGELALLQDFTKDWLAAKGLQPTPANNLLARDAYNKGKQTPADAATDFIRIQQDPASTPEQKQSAGRMLEALKQYQIAIRPVTNVTIPGLTPTAANQKLTGEEYLATLPAPTAARIRRIAMGDELAPTGRAAISGPGGQLMDAIYRYDPEFTPLLAQLRKDTLKEFTSTQTSRAGGQLLALNTLIHHGDLYQQVGEALGNGTWRPQNALYNSVANMFGKAPPTDARLVARFLAGETGKVATGGVPAEGEVNGILAQLGDDASPAQIKAAGARILQIAAGRMVPLKERRDAAKLQRFVPILGPDAQAILTRRGFDPETMQPVGQGGRQGAGGAKFTVPLKSGRNGEFDTQEQANEFRRLHPELVR